MLLLPQAWARSRQTLRSAYASRTLRRWSLIVVAAIALFGLFGFFGVPPLLRYLAQHQLSQALHRPVSVGRIDLNPYTLNLEIDRLRIGEPAGVAAPAGAAPFLTIAKLVVRPSWSALFRLKPIINEVYLEAPMLHLVRGAAGRFNFSDLLDQASQSAPGDTTRKPTLFAVSNIHVEQGRIDFDDEVLKTHHTIDQWRLGIPFVANLPSQADIFVQPLLQARIDGSALTITGKTKPFSSTLESTLEIDLNQFDLTRLLPYVPYAFPNGAPVALQQGRLSSRLGVAFARSGEQPSVKLSGELDLLDLKLADRQAAPLLSAHLIHVGANDIEPLRGIVHLDNLQIDQPSLTLVRDAQGSLNLLALTGGAPAARPLTPAVRAAEAAPVVSAAVTAPAPAVSLPAASSAAAASASTPASAVAVPSPAPFDLAIRQVALNGGSVQFDDRSVAPAGRLALKDIAVQLTDFATLSRDSAHYTLATRLESGGSLSSSGAVNLAAQQLQAKLTLDQLALPALQPWLKAAFNGQIGAGQFAADTQVQADWSKPAPAVHVAPGVFTVTGLRVLADAKSAPVLELKQMQARLTQFDLASRQVELAALSVDALTLSANRDKHGGFDLAALLPGAASPGAAAPPAVAVRAAPRGRRAVRVPEAAPAPAWHYKIGVLSLNDAALSLNDLAANPPVALKLAPLQVKVAQISDAFNQPWPVEVSGTFNKKGTFSTRGSVTLAPLTLALHVDAKNLDVAAFEPYFGARLNATVASALFSADGELKASRPADLWQAAYDGSTSLDNVRMLDRATADLFAGWRSLNVTHIKARYDVHGPDFEAGNIALSTFYARVILDSNGRLNLSNILTSTAVPATSLTRTDAAAADAASAAAAAKAAESRNAAQVASATPASAAPPLNLRFGQFLLERGRINYTDNFIKPNFSANLVNINGKIGSFGTHSTTAAPIELKGSVDGRGPLSISGTLNPLIAKPALDVTASAHGIELSSFTPYATKYAGYPIVEGRLNVDLHYKLADDLLTADNHLFIDQLTFGDHVDSATATHLPVKLAIALLKNSRGQIDVNIPVSGSLSNPQFSLGGLIWSAVVNLLEKAVTAPFTLLANAFGSAAQNLEYVEFAPGLATLSTEAQKKLDVLAKAMEDKPAIHLELFGRADPAQDVPALRRLYVERTVRQQKLKDLVGHGESVAMSDVVLTPEEHDKYLKRAYSAADFKKPHNALGLNKSLPANEMTALLEENAPVGDTELRALAQARAAAVHQYLEGKVPPERLSDRSPHLDARGITDKGATTRVDFALK
jgi:hypothetical protein